MEYVWIDTALLAVPNYAVAEDFAHELFDRVTRIADLSCSLGALQFVLSDFTEEDLWSNSCGPDFEQLEQFLCLIGLDGVFSPYDLAKAYQTVLSRACRADDCGGLEIRGVTEFASAPALPQALAPAILTKFTRLSFASVAAIGSVSDRWNVCSAFESVGLRIYEIDTTVTCAVGPHAQALGVLPRNVVGSVRVIGVPSDLVTAGQALRIWQAADCPGDLHLAIALNALALKRQSNPAASMDDIRPFAIGSEFRRTLQMHQCAGAAPYSPVTLQKCSFVIADSPNLVVGIFGRPVQESRAYDGALAHRVHLSGGGAALRLMFWQGKKGVEFANVGVKHQLLIEVGTAQNAYGFNYAKCL